MKPMFSFGIFLVVTGLLLAACSHMEHTDEASELEERIKNYAVELNSAHEQIETQRKKYEIETRHAILQVSDRDSKTGRFDTPNANPHTGLPIISRWNAYRDAEGNVVYGSEYKVQSPK